MICEKHGKQGLNYCMSCDAEYAKHHEKQMTGNGKAVDGWMAVPDNYRQQVIDELAQRSGKMPEEEWICEAWMCDSHKVRGAIATMQARLEQFEKYVLTLAEFAKTAPGRLPYLVQEAVDAAIKGSSK